MIEAQSPTEFTPDFILPQQILKEVTPKKTCNSITGLLNVVFQLLF